MDCCHRGVRCRPVRPGVCRAVGTGLAPRRGRRATAAVVAGGGCARSRAVRGRVVRGLDGRSRRGRRRADEPRHRLPGGRGSPVGPPLPALRRRASRHRLGRLRRGRGRGGGVFLLVLAMVKRTTPADASAQLPTVLATLVAVGVARSVYVWARRTAEQTGEPESVRRGRDRSLRLGPRTVGPRCASARRAARPHRASALPGRRRHLDHDGRAARHAGWSGCVDVRRRTAVTAKLEFDPARIDREVVEAVARAAGPEIDNVALRAELARQLEQVSRSRARLATAHLDERRRLERDLHDGAQQRLLALALQLQSARVNGSPQPLIDEVDRAIAELGQTVQRPARPRRRPAAGRSRRGRAARGGRRHGRPRPGPDPVRRRGPALLARGRERRVVRRSPRRSPTSSSTPPRTRHGCP